MNNRFYYLVFSLLFLLPLSGQNNFKTLPPPGSGAATSDLHDLEINPELLKMRQASATSNSGRLANVKFEPARLHLSSLPYTAGVKVFADKQNGQVFHLDGRPARLDKHFPDAEDARAYLNAVAKDLRLENPDQEVSLGEIRTDELGQTHVRLQQRYQGLTVEPADAFLHAGSSAGFDTYLGRLQATPAGVELTPTISEAEALAAARTSFGSEWKIIPESQLVFIGEPQEQSELIIYYHNDTPVLAYKLELHPNLANHRTRYVDARTGATLHELSHICGSAGLHASLPPETATVRNLNNELITLNTFSQDGQFFLFDVSRPMFRNLDGEAVGVIHTFDAGGQSPLNDGFDPTISSSVNNTDWSPTSVSVHDNAGLAYSYFLDKHERNSIDGIGGTVYSIYNVNNEDGTDMDNAFWGGRAMFYGNGDRAFQSLPRALDVAGHEMTHGVITSTADLVYELQPGAINESMADVFGYLIEGEANDHRLGEDVVNSQLFRTGALRNLRDPNNGGNRLGDRGWQPAHMNEFVVLPNNEDNDHGGVHINSGITNRAFYNFSTTTGVGDARAERVYYRALTEYLTRNSQFADLRIAVARAARDLFGAAIETAANDAFAAVGIGGEASEVEEDIETNTGDRFLLLTNTGRSALFLADEGGNLIENPLATVNILSRPSITDDGSAAYFVDDQNRLRVYDFVNRQLLFVEQNPGTIWRNIAVSKDGDRLAITTTDQDNKIFILDLVSNTFQEMTLTNPTTSQGGLSTDNVRYADIIEWEPGGEFLMYDALNFLDDGIEYWDIGFLRAWNNDTDNYGDGNITKLYSALEPGTSIGNPTFAKNSPYIIAFERLNSNNDEYTVVAANIERGETAVVWNNLRLGYPNYGVDDDRIIFDGELESGERILATVMMGDDKITTEGAPSVTIREGSWGIFFANGQRQLDTSIDGPVVDDPNVKVYPTLTEGMVTVEALGQEERSLQLFDATGRLVQRTAMSGARAEVRLSSLKAGTYFLAIPTDKGTVIRRVVRR